MILLHRIKLLQKLVFLRDCRLRILQIILKLLSTNFGLDDQYATLLLIKLTHQVSKVPVLELLTVIMCSYLLMVLHLNKPIELNLVVRKVVADEQKHLLEDVDADVGVTTDEVQEGVAAAVDVQEMVFLELGGFEEVVEDLWRCVDYSNF